MKVTTESLVRPFLEAAPAAVRPALESIGDLDRRLWTLVAEGRAAWPDLALDARVVVEFVGRQAASQASQAIGFGSLDHEARNRSLRPLRS